MVRCGTSTNGMPMPAMSHTVWPEANRNTAKSDATYKSPVFESTTTSVSGISGMLLPISVQVAAPAPLQVTLKMWPVCEGVLKLYPEYEIQAWLLLFGSIAIPVTTRVGSFEAARLASTRFQTTALPGLALMFVLTNTRPPVVPTQPVLVLLLVREITLTSPPVRLPQNEHAKQP